MLSTNKFYLALFLTLTFAVLFILYPLFASFGSARGSELLTIIRSNTIQEILKFTVFQATISTLLAVLVGFPAAYYYAHHNDTLAKLLYMTTFIPFFLPGISAVVGFLIMYGRNGILNSFLGIFGIKLQILYTFTAILLGHIFYNAPILVRVLGDALAGIPKEQIENALSDGANKWKIFWKIEFPLVLPALVAGTILIFSYCFTSFAIVLILGGSQYATLEVAIYMYLKLLAKPNIAISLAILQFLFIFAFGFFLSFFEKRESFQYGERYIEKRKYLKVYSVLFLIFETAPVIAGFAGSVYDFRRKEFLFDRIVTIFTSSQIPIVGSTIPEAILRSLLLSATTALIGMVLGFSMIWGLRDTPRGSFILRGISLLSISITPAILALSYSTSFKFIAPPLAMILLYLVVSLPINLNLIHAGTAGVSVTAIEAAKIDGASSLQILWHIIVPLFRKVLIASFSVIFAISMGEFSGSLILGGDSYPTITVAIYRLMSSRHLVEARFLSSLLVIVVLVSLALIGGFFTSFSEHLRNTGSRN